MSKLNRSRRSRAFRPGNIGFDHLEDRKLLTVDPSLVINPDVLNFDPDNITYVDLGTLEAHLEILASGLVYAGPGEIEGDEASSRSALIDIIDDKTDALIAEVDIMILQVQIMNIDLQKASLIYDQRIADYEASILVLTGATKQAAIDKRDTLVAAKTKITDNIFNNVQ